MHPIRKADNCVQWLSQNYKNYCESTGIAPAIGITALLDYAVFLLVEMAEPDKTLKELKEHLHNSVEALVVLRWNIRLTRLDPHNAEHGAPGAGGTEPSTSGKG